MTDEQLARLLLDLARPTEPDPAFADRLYGDLALRIDFATGRSRRRGVRVGVRLPSFDRPRVLAWTWVLLALALLLSLVASIAYLGTRRESPTGLVERSEALYRALPAFDMTAQVEGGSVLRFRYDGSRRLRVDVLSGTYHGRDAGRAFVFDGRTFYEFDGSGRFAGAFAAEGDGGTPWSQASRYVDTLPAGAPGWPLAEFPLTWSVASYLSLPTVDIGCSTVGDSGEEVVMGRPARHLRCDPAGVEVWVDPATLLVLRRRAADVDIAATAARRLETADPAAFAIPAGPHGEIPLAYGPLEPGTYDATGFSPAMTLALGQGWSNGYTRSTDVGVSGPDFLLTAFRPKSMVEPATGRSVPFGGDVADFVAWLRRHPSLQVGPPSATSVDGLAATEVTVAVLPGPGLAPCRAYAASDACVSLVDLGTAADGTIVGEVELTPIVSYRFIVVDVRGTPVVLCVEARTPAIVAASMPIVREAVRFP